MTHTHVYVCTYVNYILWNECVYVYVRAHTCVCYVLVSQYVILDLQF